MLWVGGTHSVASIELKFKFTELIVLYLTLWSTALVFSQVVRTDGAKVIASCLYTRLISHRGPLSSAGRSHDAQTLRVSAPAS